MCGCALVRWRPQRRWRHLPTKKKKERRKHSQPSVRKAGLNCTLNFSFLIVRLRKVIIRQQRHIVFVRMTRLIPAAKNIAKQNLSSTSQTHSSTVNVVYHNSEQCKDIWKTAKTRNVSQSPAWIDRPSLQTVELPSAGAYRFDYPDDTLFHS